MCQRFRALAGHFLRDNKIPARDREILILRTAWLSRGEYIWAAHHADYATKAGLTVEEVSRITNGPDANGWSRFDAALLRAADELQASRFISDATWKALGERYNDRQRQEVVLTVANYTMLAMYFNSTATQVPAGRTGFPTR
jgi:alkylhydroperoxidase family enzyme